MHAFWKFLPLFFFIASILPLTLFPAFRPRPATKEPSVPPEQPKRIRSPAVAGLFYPKDPCELSKTIDFLLADAKPQEFEGDLRALICPHAGYPYSGPVAASAYRQLQGSDYSTVVLLAPSHYARFSGASVANEDIYRTPLGDVPISPMAELLSRESPFVSEPHCFVQRPPWFTQASHPAPPPEEDTPETWEHSGEVQVPFLQKTLKNFKLVPVVTGEVDPEQAARVLAPYIDESTLVVTSSDLSHFHPYDLARQLDHRCTQAICDLDLEAMKSQEACGRTPILVLMHLAKQLGWKAKLLDYRNSGDTAGNKNGVVGYCAIAFYAPLQTCYTPEERSQMLSLARQALEKSAAHEDVSSLIPERPSEKFTGRKACFVTLTSEGRLRGCVGTIDPKEPLLRAVVESARNAALYDPRFAPIGPNEVDNIEIEISVLTVPERLAYSSPEDLLNKLRPHRDGVVLKMGNRVSTYLPQVWEKLPDKVEFLNSLAQKAGESSSAWRNPGTEVLVYQVESFSEPERH